MSGTTGDSVRRPGEVVFAMLLVVCSVTAFWQSFAISGLRGLSEPGVFPMLASATMLISSLLILKDVIASSSAQRDKSFFFVEIVPYRLLLIVGFILAYIIAMPLIGFIFSSSIFLFASFWLLWRKGPMISAALTLGSLAVVYFVFRMIFQVVLPGGSLIEGII